MSNQCWATWITIWSRRVQWTTVLKISPIKNMIHTYSCLIRFVSESCPRYCFILRHAAKENQQGGGKKGMRRNSASQGQWQQQKERISWQGESQLPVSKREALINMCRILSLIHPHSPHSLSLSLTSTFSLSLSPTFSLSLPHPLFLSCNKRNRLYKPRRIKFKVSQSSLPVSELPLTMQQHTQQRQLKCHIRWFPISSHRHHVQLVGSTKLVFNIAATSAH